MNGTYDCLNIQTECTHEQKKLDLNATLAQCPEYYRNESNRLQINPEIVVRQESSNLELYYYSAILAGL